MIRTSLTLMAIGKPQNLTPDDFGLIQQLLKDNPELILVLSDKRILLFSLESELKLRKSVFESPESFERAFTLEVSKVAETDTFFIVRSVDPKTELMEKIAAEVCVLGLANPQRNAEPQHVDHTQTANNETTKEKQSRTRKTKHKSEPINPQQKQSKKTKPRKNTKQNSYAQQQNLPKTRKKSKSVLTT